MKKLIIFLIAIAICSFACKNSGQESRIKLNEDEANKKVEVIIDGELFTSYIWPDDIEKPVLYPLKSSKGTLVTRGFPIAPRPGERVDHPHHVGHWLNYGDVNGLDFWNNSYAIPAEKKDKYGSIKHQKVVNVKSGDEEGTLEVETNWIDSEGNILLVENTKFVFSGDEEFRTIERFTTLTAQSEKVTFTDNKEGMVAIRMDRSFEFPSDRPIVFTDANGNPTEVAALNNEGVNGAYLSSEGIEGGDVWGTRAKWMRLSAEKEGEEISVVIMDHPENPGYPTYWHARTYGLFAANPLGQAIFTNGEKHFNFSLEPEESVTFKYKIAIKSGSLAGEAELNEMFDAFSKK